MTTRAPQRFSPKRSGGTPAAPQHVRAGGYALRQQTGGRLNRPAGASSSRGCEWSDEASFSLWRRDHVMWMKVLKEKVQALVPKDAVLYNPADDVTKEDLDEALMTESLDKISKRVQFHAAWQSNNSSSCGGDGGSSPHDALAELLHDATAWPLDDDANADQSIVLVEDVECCTPSWTSQQAVRPHTAGFLSHHVAPESLSNIVTSQQRQPPRVLLSTSTLRRLFAPYLSLRERNDVEATQLTERIVETLLTLQKPKLLSSLLRQFLDDVLYVLRQRYPTLVRRRRPGLNAGARCALMGMLTTEDEIRDLQQLEKTARHLAALEDLTDAVVAPCDYTTHCGLKEFAQKLADVTAKHVVESGFISRLCDALRTVDAHAATNATSAASDPRATDGVSSTVVVAAARVSSGCSSGLPSFHECRRSGQRGSSAGCAGSSFAHQCNQVEKEEEAEEVSLSLWKSLHAAVDCVADFLVTHFDDDAPLSSESSGRGESLPDDASMVDGAWRGVLADAVCHSRALGLVCVALNPSASTGPSHPEKLRMASQVLLRFTKEPCTLAYARQASVQYRTTWEYLLPALIHDDRAVAANVLDAIVGLLDGDEGLLPRATVLKHFQTHVVAALDVALGDAQEPSASPFSGGSGRYRSLHALHGVLRLVSHSLSAPPKEKAHRTAAAYAALHRSVATMCLEAMQSVLLSSDWLRPASSGSAVLCELVQFFRVMLRQLSFEVVRTASDDQQQQQPFSAAGAAAVHHPLFHVYTVEFRRGLALAADRIVCCIRERGGACKGLLLGCCGEMLQALGATTKG